MPKKKTISIENLVKKFAADGIESSDIIGLIKERNFEFTFDFITKLIIAIETEYEEEFDSTSKVYKDFVLFLIENKEKRNILYDFLKFCLKQGNALCTILVVPLSFLCFNKEVSDVILLCLNLFDDYVYENLEFNKINLDVEYNNYEKEIFEMMETLNND
jgi:hypothetical protein